MCTDDALILCHFCFCFFLPKEPKSRLCSYLSAFNISHILKQKQCSSSSLASKHSFRIKGSRLQVFPSNLYYQNQLPLPNVKYSSSFFLWRKDKKKRVNNLQILLTQKWTSQTKTSFKKENQKLHKNNSKCIKLGCKGYIISLIIIMILPLWSCGNLLECKLLLLLGIFTTTTISTGCN